MQGVGFRACLRDEALRIGVSGWVRNRPDDSVEAVFEGSEAQVAELVAWCRDGPRWARVERVLVSEEVCEGLLRFEVRR